MWCLQQLHDDVTCDLTAGSSSSALLGLLDRLQRFQTYMISVVFRPVTCISADYLLPEAYTSSNCPATVVSRFQVAGTG